MPINQNQALFSLLGTTYGGNGQTTFGLPDLRGRVPTHAGNGFSPGQRAGEQAVTLGLQHLPAHTHVLQASGNSAGTRPDPSAAFLAPVNGAYGAPADLTTLHPGSVTTVGAIRRTRTCSRTSRCPSASR